MSTDTAQIPTDFWAQIDHQVARIINEQPNTFDAVRTILLDLTYDQIVIEVHRNGPRPFDIDSAFFAGSGGDTSLASALFAAGWRTTAADASYYYAMTHPQTGEALTYIEGDVVRGDRLTESEPTVPVPDSPEEPVTNWDVNWTIDAEGSSPAAAAAEVWKNTFRRGHHQPCPDEACVFTVSDGEKTVEIDLSDETYADLFDG